ITARPFRPTRAAQECSWGQKPQTAPVCGIQDFSTAWMALTPALRRLVLIQFTRTRTPEILPAICWLQERPQISNPCITTIGPTIHRIQPSRPVCPTLTSGFYPTTSPATASQPVAPFHSPVSAVG